MIWGRYLLVVEGALSPKQSELLKEKVSNEDEDEVDLEFQYPRRYLHSAGQGL